MTDQLNFDAAMTAVRSVVPASPCYHEPALSACLGREVWFKLENLQVTGSFKVRGAAARMSVLTESERAAGVVTCSSGNHGKAVAYVAGELRIPAIVCVPGWVDPGKLAAIRATGAEARLVGDSYDEAEVEADRISREEGRVFVHPFDDSWVAAGQGTVAMEILDSVPEPAEVIVPLSGGGLVGGMAAFFASRGMGDLVTAVSARNANVMAQSLHAGRPIQLPEEETIASALAGGIGLDNRVTFDLVKRHVSRHLEVSEAQIRNAIRVAFSGFGTVLEGGGAVGLAGLMGPWLEGQAAGADPGATDGPVVVVLSGGNLDGRRLAEVMAEKGGAA